MIEYAETIARDLQDIAEHADPGSADLAEIVIRRYTRRRWIRVASSVVAGVAAVTVGIAVAVPVITGVRAPTSGAQPPLARTSTTTVSIPAGPGAWAVPPTGATLPSLASVWPGAVVHLPTHMPDGGVPFALAAIDATRVLVGSGPTQATTDALFTYDTANGSFRRIATIPHGSEPRSVSRWAVSAHSVVWDVDGPGSFEVFTVPLSGGSPRQIARVSTPASDTGPWFATDDAVYWSGAQPGVVRLPLSGGSLAPVPGFGDMYLLHGTSAWAVQLGDVHASPYARIAEPSDALGQSGVARRLKNLVTGAQFDVSAPPGARALACTAAFCVGTVGSAASPIEFIQRPDGADRVTLDGGDVRAIYAVGDGGLLVSSPEAGDGLPGHDGRISWVICDPISGIAGSVSGGAYDASDDAALGFPTDNQASVTSFFLIADTR